jgi:hypothetical protein
MSEPTETATPFHIPFPDIKQFRQVVREICSHAQYVGLDAEGKAKYDPTLPRPTLTFEGTVKLHGTNASICHDRESDQFWFQSRELILGPGADNAGFKTHFLPRMEAVKALFAKLGTYTTAAVYGEWCGQGINGGTAISNLPKMLVIFAVKADDRWLTLEGLSDPTNQIRHIHEFDMFYTVINFERPELAQNSLCELTLGVERQCPVAFRLGVAGTGEGIVWRCTTPGWEDSRFWFKVKGEKHSATKVKTLAAVDIEKANSIAEFVERVVTAERCEQGVSKLIELGKPIDRTSMGDFLRWVFNDIAKEESDTAEASGIELKKIGGAISLAAKRWFFANEAKFP